MKKLINLLLCLCFTILLQAQVSKTINIVTAGTLNTLLTATEKTTVTNLTITGTIDARDFKTMRDDMPVLAVLDISSVTIAAYSGTDGTAGTSSTSYLANGIPITAFSNSRIMIRLNSVIIPFSTTSIGYQAFFSCRFLTNITIPYGVTTIGDYAFAQCEDLTSVTIPSSVTFSGEWLFMGCYGLTWIYLNSVTPIYISSTTFYSAIKTSCVLHVPAGSISAYRAANVWKDFINIVDNLPILTSSKVNNITANTALSGGNIINEGLYPVTTRGVCWSTTANPTIADNKTSDSTGNGIFTSAITGLSPLTTYHARAYATNSVGTSYGSDLTFTTLGVPPTVSTTLATNITTTTASTGGNVTDAGTSAVTARGVCWSTTANPTIANNKTTDGTGIGVFSSSITGLTSGVTYHIRAYTISSVGTSYGSDIIFTTLGTAPTVTTTSANSITNTTAKTGGNVTSSGTSVVTTRGVCWSTTANPTISNNKTSDGTGTGIFTSTITGLTLATTYHVRAYATSNDGTSYGSDLTFTTSSIVPASFSLSTPANGAWINTTPLFQWAKSTGAFSYNLYIDDMLKKENITTNSYQILTTEALSSGMHTWYVVAGDGYAIQSNETWSFRVDVTQPTAFSHISPADNSWTASIQPTLTWGASTDVNSGLAKYQLWIDGSLNQDNIATTTTSSTPLGRLSNGTHEWQIKAIDNAGNERFSNQAYKIRVDNTPPGQSDNCLYFDGVDDYATTSNSLAFKYTLTFEAWIKPEGNGERGIAGTSSGFHVKINPSNKIGYRYYTFYGSIWSGWALSNTVLNNYNWYHIAITHNSITGTIKIYINGVLDASYTADQIYNYNNNVLTLGSGAFQENNYKGCIDEVRIWNIEKTKDEIQKSMNNVLEYSCVNGLLSYYRFNANLFDETNKLNYISLNKGAFLDKSDKSTNGLGELTKLKQPSCSQYVNTDEPTFSWGAVSDLGIGFQKYQLWIDGILNKDNLRDSTWTVITPTYDLFDTLPLSYGFHTWFVTGYDSLGNNQSSYSRIFYIDNVKPDTFNLVSPASNQIVNLPTPNFTWQATADNTGGSGLRKYQLLINGIVNRDSIPISQTTVAPKSALAQGAYTWFIKVYDNVGNVRQSTQTNTFYVDWEDPTAFNLIAPLNNSTLTIARPEFKWNSSIDIGSGISKYELYITGQKPITILPTDTTVLITFDLPNGNYTWFVKAYDGAGAFTSSDAQTFTINAVQSEMEQLELNNSIQIFPNPFAESFYVCGIEGMATLTLLDVSGRIMITKQVVDNESISVNNFLKGMYIVKIITAEGIVERKVIKK